MKLIIFLIVTFIYCNHEFQKDFVEAAINRTNYDITYTDKWFAIDYPNGDIPDSLGVCTDVIIRSYRGIGTDLQILVHEDIKQNFNDYPIQRIRPNQTRADYTIDHRRVYNLQTFFEKFGEVLPNSDNPNDYQPGDIVTWALSGHPWHIGIVVDNLMIVHNIGHGVVLEDVLFDYKITGHYRYVPEQYKH